MGDDEVNVSKKRQRRRQFSSSDESEGEDGGDELLAELDVRMANLLPNTEAFTMQFPARKKNVFDNSHPPQARFKKNVKFLELRIPSNTHSGSYDKEKSRVLLSPSRSASHSSTASRVKADSSSLCTRDEDIFEGRAFQTHAPVINAFGQIKHDTFLICPLSGTFEMRKSLAHINQKKSSRRSSARDESEMTEESDTETSPAEVSKTVRVKFAKPETERQKKRREASALHRERMMANDAWVKMNVCCKDNPLCVECTDKMAAKVPQADSGQVQQKKYSNDRKLEDVRNFVQKAIIASSNETSSAIDDASLCLHKRIISTSREEQIRMQMLKCQVIKTTHLAELVDPSMTREELLRQLQECAHLVRGVWVVKSEYLFSNLPPAHGYVPGKRDEHRGESWRNARDFALALLDAKCRLTRNTLKRGFRLNDRDVEQILSTFAAKSDRCWKLKLDPDEEFLNDPANLLLILYETKFWYQHWEDIHRKIEKCQSPRRTPSKRVKRELIEPQITTL
ncbi:hypothetical protein WR25_03875 [Diploscapter pachys]|uniref:DNA-directed RNA polymerase III subunit RPC5 n=1 Tax=Diploscapter pachys TaxID=2018661 RepID=A0A2A2JMU4_9BILA|nr:hypothetical protein WR25_03875 [Diploscapter pachys]